MNDPLYNVPVGYGVFCASFYGAVAVDGKTEFKPLPPVPVCLVKLPKVELPKVELPKGVCI